MTRCGAAPALVVAAVAVAIGSGAAARAFAASAPSTTFRACSPQEVRHLVASFIQAFNTGNSARLNTLFAKDDHDGDAATPSFQWYSTGPPGARSGRVAEDRSTLIRYFAARHRRFERLRLERMSAGGSANGYFNFGFRLYRQARDMRRPGTFEGKGAAICAESAVQLAVWSVGRRVS